MFDIRKFGEILFSRNVWDANAHVVWDLFFSDKSNEEKIAEVQAALKADVDALEAAVATIIPIPGAEPIINGIVSSTPVEQWETAMTRAAAEMIVAALRPFARQAKTAAAEPVAPGDKS